MPDQVDLDALDRLIAAATPRPWRRSTIPSVRGVWADNHRHVGALRHADEILCVALRNAAPDMSAELRAARATIERLQDQLHNRRTDEETVRYYEERAKKAEARAKAGELLASQVLALIEWIDALADRCDEGLERASIGSLALTAASVKAEEIIAGKEPGEAASEQYAEELVRRTRAELARRDAELREARELLATFMAKWTQIEPSISAAFFVAFQNRGMPYSGPTVEAELKAIRAYLARTAPAQDRTGGEA